MSSRRLSCAKHPTEKKKNKPMLLDLFFIKEGGKPSTLPECFKQVSEADRIHLFADFVRRTD